MKALWVGTLGGLLALGCTRITEMGVVTCDDSECTGCCDESGACLSGTDDSACGNQGLMCIACGFGEICLSGGCVPSLGVDAGADAGLDAGTDAGVDAGADAGNDAGVDAGTDAGPVVTGVRFLHFHTPTGVDSVPEDFTANPVEIWVDSSGGYAAAAPTYRGDGGFAFDVLSGSTYAIRAGSSWFVSDALTIDVSDVRFGRSDADPMTSDPSSVTLSLSGLAPWSPFDELSLTSNEAWHRAYLFADPAVGSTAMTNEPAEYGALASNAEVDPSRGETLHLSQRSWTFSATEESMSITRAAAFTNVAIRSGMPLSLYGTLNPVTQSTLTVDVQLADFESLALSAHPDAVIEPFFSNLVVFPERSSLAPGYVGFLEDPLGAFSPDSPSNGTYTVTYGNPQPTIWTPAIVAIAWVGTYFQLPGTTRAAIVPTAVVQQRVFPLAPGAVLAPVFGPVGDIEINGQAGQQDMTISTTTPVLAWSAPVGAPASVHYRVRVQRVFVNSINATTQRGIANVITDGTSIRIPPGILSSGERYVLMIIAQTIGTDPLDRDESMAITGLITVQ